MAVILPLLLQNARDFQSDRRCWRVACCFRGAGGCALPEQLQRARRMPVWGDYSVFVLQGLGRRRLFHAYVAFESLACWFVRAQRIVPRGGLSVPAADLLSLRSEHSGLCPTGTAWTDNAVGIDNAHNQAECSNRGICDYASGKCMCEEGFEGLACQRSTLTQLVCELSAFRCGRGLDGDDACDSV